MILEQDLMKKYWILGGIDGRGRKDDDEIASRGQLAISSDGTVHRHLTGEKFKKPTANNCRRNRQQITAEGYYGHLMVCFSLIKCVNSKFLPLFAKVHKFLQFEYTKRWDPNTLLQRCYYNIIWKKVGIYILLWLLCTTTLISMHEATTILLCITKSSKDVSDYIIFIIIIFTITNKEKGT
jgi:hypothetical protein